MKKPVSRAVILLLCLCLGIFLADRRLSGTIPRHETDSRNFPEDTEVETTDTKTPTPAVPPTDFTFTPTTPPDTPQQENVIPEDSAVAASTDSEILETTIASGLSIKNATDYAIDIPKLLSEGLSQQLLAGKPQILIIHTHASEAYTPSGSDRYTPTDPYRTEDPAFNMIRVGDHLCEKLQAHGLNVLHDREIYDYPSYTGSYTRSGEAISSYLNQYPSIAIVIDLHRDALGSEDVIYKTVAEAGGACASQVMLLVGTDASGLHHPNWQENLKLALYLQSAAARRHPTLVRPVSVVNERYNQHLTTGSMIIEVGSAGNTLQEALTAIELFADAVGPSLYELVEKEE